MKIKDLVPNTTVERLTVQVMKKKPVIKKETYSICDAECEDETGTVTVTLWNEETLIQEGTIITINNGWTKTYNNKISVSSGKKGAITVTP
jgi:ssDNA-binding replication factor A large subunit